MATVTTREIVETMLRNEGVYPGDPACVAISEYSVHGQRVWHIAYSEHDLFRFKQSTVFDKRLLWSRDTGLTEAGHNFLGSETKGEGRREDD